MGCWWKPKGQPRNRSSAPDSIVARSSIFFADVIAGSQTTAPRLSEVPAQAELGCAVQEARVTHHARLEGTGRAFYCIGEIPRWCQTLDPVQCPRGCASC